MKLSATLELDRSDIRWKLSAGAVDSAGGVIRGCTVMKAGVQAAGKFVMINAQGAITRDEKLSVKKIPVFTDARTLETLMTAARVAGKRVKVREDHDDSIGARAGFSNNFVMSGDKVAADVNLFGSYRNRAVMLETASETPDQIGLSIDFDPSYEISGDRALLRVDVLHGVDIVDEGAVTPDGLFSSRGVDINAKDVLAAKPQPVPDMPTAPAALSLDDLMSAVTALKGQVADCMTAMAKFAPPPPPPAKPDADKDGMAAIKAENEKLAAALKEQADQLKAVVASQAQIKKERALLGFRGSDAERVHLAAGSAEDIEKAIAGKKSYLDLVSDACAKDTKLSRSHAHDVVQGTPEGRAAYAEHLLARGVTTREQMTSNRAA